MFFTPFLYLKQNKVLYLKICVLLYRVSMCSCTHVGRGRRLHNKIWSEYSWLMPKALMWQLQISSQVGWAWTWKSGVVAQGSLLASVIFQLRMFPENPGFGFKRAKRVLFYRQVLPAPEMVIYNFIFPSGWVAMIEEIRPDRSVHILCGFINQVAWPHQGHV